MEYLQKAKTIPQVPFPRTINFYIDECEENVLERTKLTNLLVTLESGKFIAIGRDCSDTNLSTRRSGKQFIDVRINLLGRLSISRVQLVLKKNYDGTFTCVENSGLNPSSIVANGLAHSEASISLGSRIKLGDWINLVVGEPIYFSLSYGLISSTTKSDPSISTKGEYNPNQDGMMGMFYYVAPNTKPIFLNINTVNHEARAYELELPKGGGTIQIGDTRYAYQDAQGSEKDAHPIIRIDQHPVPYILRANLPVGATVIIPLGKVNVDNDLAVDSFPIEDDLIVLIPGSKIILLDGTEICVAGEIIQTIEAKVQTVIVSLRNELLKKI